MVAQPLLWATYSSSWQTFQCFFFPNTHCKPPLVQLEVVFSHPTYYPYLTTTSFEVVIEMRSPLSPLFSMLNLYSSHSHFSYDLHSRPFNSFHYLSLVPCSTSVSYSERLHRFNVLPHQQDNGFSSPADHSIADVSWDAAGLLGQLGTMLAHIPASPDPSLLVNFPVTVPYACSIAWSCCHRSAEPSTWPCWISVFC